MSFPSCHRPCSSAGLTSTHSYRHGLSLRLSLNTGTFFLHCPVTPSRLTNLIIWSIISTKAMLLDEWLRPTFWTRKLDYAGTFGAPLRLRVKLVSPQGHELQGYLKRSRKLGRRGRCCQHHLLDKLPEGCELCLLHKNFTFRAHLSVTKGYLGFAFRDSWQPLMFIKNKS